MARKKYLNGYYELDKREQYRIIPKETLEKLRTKLLINESELKLYFFMANLQEVGASMGHSNMQITFKEIRELMGIKKDNKTNKRLYLELCWLKAINIVDFDMKKIKNGNFNNEIWVVQLNKVNFYTNAENFLEDSMDSVCPQEIKDKFLNNVVMIDFEE